MVMFLSKIKKCRVGKEVILLSVDSETEWRRARNYTKKEPNTLQWIETYFKPGEIIYDIGANIGQYSLYPAKVLKGDCKIFAFEPEALNFAKLNINIHLNKLQQCIMAYPLAISNKNKLSHFFINKFSYGQASHGLDCRLDPFGKEFIPEHVQGTLSITLDSLVFQYHLEFPNHLKIDVDGPEKEVIEGGDRVFSDKRVKSVLVEFSFYEGWEERKKWFLDLFLNKGYQLVEIPDKRKLTQNLIFSRI